MLENYQKWDLNSLFCISVPLEYLNRWDVGQKMRDAKKASRQTEATEAISHYLSTVSRKAVALGVMV
jgi:hypothetical protein